MLRTVPKRAVLSGTRESRKRVRGKRPCGFQRAGVGPAALQQGFVRWRGRWRVGVGGGEPPRRVPGLQAACCPPRCAAREVRGARCCPACSHTLSRPGLLNGQAALHLLRPSAAAALAAEGKVCGGGVSRPVGLSPPRPRAHYEALRSFKTHRTGCFGEALFCGRCRQRE